MPNISHEQCLIDCFVCALRRVEDCNLSIRCIHNDKCKSRTFADVEFTASSGVRWAIEAKYGAPQNKANEVYKLFGDLLRETGRENRRDCKIGLLLHHEMEGYFRDGVRRIDRQKFIRFGRLVPVEAVFVFAPTGVTCKNWTEFYDQEAGRLVR